MDETIKGVENRVWFNRIILHDKKGACRYG